MHLGVEANFSPATKAHPGFHVLDLGLLKDRLLSAGFPIIEDEPRPGYERFYSKDPFGNRLEFLRPVCD